MYVAAAVVVVVVVFSHGLSSTFLEVVSSAACGHRSEAGSDLAAVAG